MSVKCIATLSNDGCETCEDCKNSILSWKNKINGYFLCRLGGNAYFEIFPTEIPIDSRVLPVGFGPGKDNITK